MAHQRGAAAFGDLQRLHRRGEDADVAGHRPQPERREGLGEEREDLGIGAGGIVVCEELVAHLEILGGALGVFFLPPKDLAAIGVARGRGAAFHVHLHDGDGEVRAQHDLAPRRVVGHVGAGADVLAVEVEQGLGGLEDGAVDVLRPGLQEARAQPDGYTLLVGSMSTHAMNPALMANMPFKGVDDFTPLGLLAYVTNTMVVNPSVPANNVKELIAYAKANPGKLAYASAGPGSTNHLSAVLFEKMAGVEMLPYLKDYANTRMALAFVNGDAVMFEIPEATYAVDLDLRGFMKIPGKKTPAQQQWVYGAYLDVRVYEPEFNVEFFKGQLKTAVQKIVPVSQVRVDEFPVVSEAFKGVCLEAIAKIRNDTKTQQNVIKKCKL